MQIIKKTMPFVIILGLIALTIFRVFNLDNQLLTTRNVNGVQMYVFNIHQYLDNLNQVTNRFAVDFATIIPSRSWETTSATFIQKEFWDTLLNNMALVFDWLYFPINFILYILRWVAWLLVLLLALIGWPIELVGQSSSVGDLYSSTLITILKWIIQRLYIPYL